MGRSNKDDTARVLAKGLDLLRAGKPAQAEPLFDRLLAAQPENFDALRLRGIAGQLQGKAGDAVRYLSRAVSARPTSGETHYNLGLALNTLKRHEEAVASFERALEHSPGDAETHDALGGALTALKRYDDAIACYRRAVKIKPGFGEAHNNLGFTLAAANQLKEAVASLRRAVKLNPRSAEALINLGGVLNRLGKHQDAAKTLRRAISLQGGSAEAHSNLGVTLANLRQYEASLAAFVRAVEINPAHDSAFGQGALIARRICDWSKFSQTQPELTKRVRTGRAVISPFAFLTFSDDPADQLLCARQYAGHKGFSGARRLETKVSGKDKRIRVAYVSADFHEHPVAYQMAELFERHDRNRFEIVGVSLGRDDQSPVGKRLRRAFDKFVDVHTASHEATAALIAREKVHIAVDLNGYTADARPEIFARRPAPLQVSYLGYPCTMGTDFIDYIIVDPRVAPEDHQPHFSEKLVRLPDSYLVTDGNRTMAEHGPSRRDAGLPEDGFVFCCFHNSYKITPAVFDIWMRLLGALPESAVWLRLDDATAIGNLRREAAARDVDPDRLVIAGRVGMDDHLARHRLADLFLDALPYNAHSSASDALWAGLPVLTCAGATFAGRVGVSLLHAIGLPELITHSLEDYEALALKLAREPESLSGIRDRLAQNRGTQPLFDCARFCRHLEQAYETMIGAWQSGKAPAPITVEPIP